MDRETRITQMEAILNSQTEAVEALMEALERVRAGQKDYVRLSRYYGSMVFRKDMEADQKGLLPEDLPRGVLSEDGVYTFLFQYRDAALRMLETAASMLRAGG